MKGDLAQQVKAFMAWCAWTEADLAREVARRYEGDRPPKRQDIEHLLHKKIETPRYIAALAATMGTDAATLAGNRYKPPDEATGEVAVPLLSGETITPQMSGYNRLASLAKRTVVQTPLRLKDLDMKALPRLFSLVLEDDAMAPAYPVGTVGRFAVGVAPVAGRPVLVVDRDGHGYVREYRPRTVTHWVAAPLSPSFEVLDSARDQLTILAVMIGHDWMDVDQATRGS